jgi:hypothetical protein
MHHISVRENPDFHRAYRAKRGGYHMLRRNMLIFLKLLACDRIFPYGMIVATKRGWRIKKTSATRT